MIPEQHFKALEIIVNTLKGTGIDWAVIGSTNLALQGVDVEVHDIDLLTDKTGACKASEAFKEYIVKPVEYKEKGSFKSYNGLFKIEGIDIEVIGEIQHKLPNGEWSKKSRIDDKLLITYHGLHIPLTPLRAEYEAYKSMGRLEKAEKIKQVLDRRD
jgi:hypothetical protein